MSILVRAKLGADGWASLAFPFNRTLVDLLKSVPGSRWDKTARVWNVSAHALAVLAPTIDRSGLGRVVIEEPVPAPLPPLFLTGPKSLRPYQETAVARMLSNAGFLLTFDPRVGKTPCGIAAIAAALATRKIERAIVLYPAGVREEWTRQLKEWAGLVLTPLEGLSPIDTNAVDVLASQPWLVLGCHYEILGNKADIEAGSGLLELAARGPFALVADEVHLVKNRKAGRTKVALALAAHENCVHRWGLTGTPMRNRPRDIWAAFEFAFPASMGGYWKFCQRYAAAHEGAYGWVDDGSSNEDELATRLRAISFRLTRADVAAYLPKSDRKVVLCGMSAAAAKTYAGLERALGPAALRGLGDADASGSTMDALRALATETVKSKIPVAIDRLLFHAQERRVKVLVFANFHESLKSLWDALEPEPELGLKKPLGDLPVFVAGGWMLPDKRKGIRDQWAACPGPAVLLANTISSGVGIDLSDADTALFLELAWVPADFLQAEARIQDVHLGKRTSPPLYEYLLVKGTIDEDMGLALVNKAGTIESIVGGNDAELAGMSGAIRGSGVVSTARIALNKADPDAVNAALARLQARLLGKVVVDPSATLAIEAAEAFEDDEATEEEIE